MVVVQRHMFTKTWVYDTPQKVIETLQTISEKMGRRAFGRPFQMWWDAARSGAA